MMHVLLESIDGLTKWILLPEPLPRIWVTAIIEELRPPFPPDIDKPPKISKRHYAFQETRKTLLGVTYAYYKEFIQCLNS